jgi:hypothetical protein
MSARFTVSVLAGVLLLAPGGVSTAHAQLLGTQPLALPITGTVSGGVQFAGTAHIQRFAVVQGATVAVAAITGVTIDPTGAQARTGLTATVLMPVTVSAAAGVGGAAYRFDSRPRFQAPGFRLASQTCGAVHVEIGATTVNLMGVAVTTNPMVLDVGADVGGLIGSLVCQILGVLANPLMLTSLLNSLLGQLGGIVGGVLPLLPI